MFCSQYAISCKLNYRRKIIFGLFEINLSDLEKGMYMINVETTNGTMSENVIVQ